MTLQACGINYYPTRLGGGEASAGLVMSRSSFTFDSTTDRMAWVGFSNFSDTIASVHFRTGTVTTGCVMRIQIESVTNGRPSGTIIAAGASGTVTINNTDDSVWKTVTIGTPPTLAVGDAFAIVMAYSSGTTPNLAIPGTAAEAGDAAGYPTGLQDTGTGAWAIQSEGWEWIVDLGSGTVACLPQLSPSEANATHTAFNNGSSPDEYALKLTLPFKCRVIGLSCIVANVAAGADFTMSLWPASSSVDGDALGQITIDGDSAPSTTADAYYTGYFTPVTLNAATTYYIGVRADTANDLAIKLLVAPTGITGAKEAFPIQAVTAHLATRTWSAGTAGAWTETATTSLPIMSLVYDQLDDGAGGSGLSAPKINGVLI